MWIKANMRQICEHTYYYYTGCPPPNDYTACYPSKKKKLRNNQKYTHTDTEQ